MQHSELYVTQRVVQPQINKDSLKLHRCSYYFFLSLYYKLVILYIKVNELFCFQQTDTSKLTNDYPYSQTQTPGSQMMPSPTNLHHMQQLLQQHVLSPTQLQNLMKQQSLLQQQHQVWDIQFTYTIQLIIPALMP